jgi:peptidoglycan/LPS O-acetylase OafA/YrhL
LDSFRRITTNGDFIPEIDGLRFVAIISVVFLRAYAELLNRIATGPTLSTTPPGNAPFPVDVFNPHGLFRLLGHGGYGVEVFFAISGFILAWPLARQHIEASQKVKLRAYFLRRITRLEPPYILARLGRAVLLLVIAIDQARFVLVPEGTCPGSGPIRDSSNLALLLAALRYYESSIRGLAGVPLDQDAPQLHSSR